MMFDTQSPGAVKNPGVIRWDKAGADPALTGLTAGFAAIFLEMLGANANAKMAGGLQPLEAFGFSEHREKSAEQEALTQENMDFDAIAQHAASQNAVPPFAAAQLTAIQSFCGTAPAAERPTDATTLIQAQTTQNSYTSKPPPQTSTTAQSPPAAVASAEVASAEVVPAEVASAEVTTVSDSSVRGTAAQGVAEIRASATGPPEESYANRETIVASAPFKTPAETVKTDGRAAELPQETEKQALSELQPEPLTERTAVFLESKGPNDRGGRLTGGQANQANNAMVSDDRFTLTPAAAEIQTLLAEYAEAPETGDGLLRIPAEDFARELPRIIFNRQMPETEEGGTSEFILRLEPEEMGRVAVKLVVRAGEFSIRIYAENPDSKSILESSLPGLKQSFEEQGLRCGSIDVELGGQYLNQRFYQQQGDRQPQEQWLPASAEITRQNEPPRMLAAINDEVFFASKTSLDFSAIDFTV